MSLKPPKKSDLNKQWMRTRQSKSVLIQPEYHLIITEGTKTEPKYFEGIQNTINRNFRDKIQLKIYGEGDNTLGLLEKTLQRVRNSGIIYKHVWIVYDTDDFPAERINLTAEECENLTNDDMPFGQISVLNYGLCCTLTMWIPICTDLSTIPN